MSSAGIRIGCAGAGILGSAIMARLLDSHFEVRVWNRTRDKLAPLIDAGARAVAHPADLVQDADFVLTCLTDGAAVEAVVFGENGIASAGSNASLLIDMSTVGARPQQKDGGAPSRGVCDGLAGRAHLGRARQRPAKGEWR